MQAGINWDAYTDFWYFVNERHRISIKRGNNEPKPWSDDPIFQKWKFCNVFRLLDTQSQYLWGVLTHGKTEDKPAYETLFNIFVFRAFNWYPTYKALGLWQSSWNADGKTVMLDVWRAAGNQLTSGAYMIRGREGMSKQRSICLTLADVWREIEPLTIDIQKENSLENTFNSIEARNFWGWGKFTAYQVALDTMMTTVFFGTNDPPLDLNTWCEFGPGAKRGLREIWPHIPLAHKWCIEGAKHLLEDQIKYRESHVPELNLQDIEFSLCELSKYRRIKAGGRSKATYNGQA